MANEPTFSSKNIEQNVYLEGNGNIFVTGVTDVEKFCEEEISLVTVRGRLIFSGTGFRMEHFDTDAGEVRARGSVSSFEYCAEKRAGFLSRLFAS